ncbi:MAG TPA: oligopeptide transporter, OPT family, partial [Candidatus Acidoferrales bacterium]
MAEQTGKGWSSTAPPGEFKPFIPPEQSPAEFTLRAIFLGAVFGILFGAVTVYVGLRAGLTVSASIPIAVLSISILRAFGRATILENNIVQTIGSAGESVAAGVIFTLPALIFLGFELEYSRIFLLAMIGGWLGVLFMIPLRRQLIVKEHGNLLYPEGTACADVLVAGERGGSFAGRVFWGLGLGGAYTFLMKSVGAWREMPLYEPSWLPGASFRAAITTEYLGVGYIIGPRIAGVIFAGGVFSWLVMMPAIKFFGSLMPDVALYPSTVPIPQMTSDQLWASYIRPMGAGAVAAAGLITLLKTMPTIVGALSSGMKDIRAQQAGREGGSQRTERDMPMAWVVYGSLGIVAMMWLFLTIKPVPGAPTSALENLLAALLVVIFGFLFVTVSSRICGLIGTS